MKHAAAYASLGNVEMQVVCDSNSINAQNMAGQYKFRRVEFDWKKAVSADDVDVVCICVPNHMHFEIAKAAILAGKNVVCEKPLGMNSKESAELSELAAAHSVRTKCCFNLIHAPAIQFIKAVIDRGELGDVVCFRGAYDNDRLSDPNRFFEWRMSKKISEGGSICDLGLNIIAISQFLLGDIISVAAMTNVIYKERLDNNGNLCEVENDDIAQLIYKYKNTGIGYISCNRVAPGSKQDMKLEIQFTQGAIRYSLERMNEVRIFRTGNRGFETIISDDNGWFNIGYEDLKVLDADSFISSIVAQKVSDTDFCFATKIDRIIEAVLEAANEQAWIKI